MKYALLLIGIISSTQLFAGAYNTSCSDASGSVAISKSELYIKKNELAKQYEWSSSTLPASFANSEVENKNNAISINVIGKVKTLGKKSEIDGCGNTASIENFAAKVELRDSKGKLVKTTYLICEDYSKPGHCL